MTQRPPGLPDFRRPPVAEVVLGVQFDSLERFLLPHYGTVWEDFRREYPEVEEQPPLEPVFETFGQPSPLSPLPKIQVLNRLPTPRVFFLNTARTMLFQVQRDRLLHNWRGEGSDYPRFAQMLKSFAKGYEVFCGAIERLGVGPVVPNQCEVTYVNPIPFPNETPFSTVFPFFARIPSVVGLDAPEDGKFILRYVIKTEDRRPAGRLIAVAEPAWKQDGTRVVQFTLTARGIPEPTSLDGIVAFLETGRACIVNGFTSLTSPEMHQKWERTQ